MRRGSTLCLAALAVCSLAAPASAAGRFDADVRARPTLVDVGATVRVSLTVYSVTRSGRVRTDARRFHLVAVSPLGDRVELGLRHVARGAWTGAVRLRVAGRWVVRISDWPAGLAPSATVYVRESLPLPSPSV
jgi:hypothetical protein